MSKSRIVLRVSLVLLLVGTIGYVVFTAMTKDKAEIDWRRAQKAIEKEDYETARIHLLNLLDKEPENGEGHYALASVYVEAARKEGVQVGFGSHPEAYPHIVSAARLKPDDLEVQKDAMLAHIHNLDMRAAASIADQVIKNDPKNVDALYALAWRAVANKQSRTADQLFLKFEGLTNRRPFRTLGLMASHFQTTGNDAQLQQIYANAAGAAKTIDGKLFASFSSREYESMDSLLLSAVGQTPDLATACERLESWFAGNDKLIETESRKPADLATMSARMAEVLRSKKTGDVNDTVAARADELQKRCRELWDAAAESESTDINVYKQAAQVAFEEQDIEAAKNYITKAFAAYAKTPEGDLTEELENQRLDLHLLAARQLVAQRDFAAAEEHIEPLLKSEKGRGWGELLAGSVAASHGRLERAVEHYEMAQRELGNTLLVRIALANTYLASKRWKDAISHLRALHDQFDRFTPEQRAWAEQYLGTEAAVDFGELRAKLAIGDWEGAQPHLRELKGSDLESNAWLVAIAYLWTNKKPEQAVALLNDARRKFPDDVGLARFQLNVYAQTKQMEEGTKFIEQFVSQKPEDFARQLMLCQWRLARSQFPQARVQLEKLLLEHKESGRQRTTLMALKAHVLLKLDRPEDALEVVEELRSDPDAAAAANVIGAMAELRRDNVDGAAAALDAAQGANPDSALIPFLKGELSVVQGDYEAAVESFSKAIDVTALQDRARAAMLQAILQIAREKSPEEAEKKVDELLKRHPDDTGVLLAKANLDLSQGKIDQGLFYLDRISLAQPNSATGPYLKATALARTNQLEKAKKELELGLKREPSHVASLLLLSQTCLALQRNADALDYAVQAIEKNPQILAAYFARVQALQRLERHDEAVNVLANLIKAQPKLTDAYLVLAGIYLGKNRADQALEIYVQARKVLPEDLRLAVAEIALLAKGDREAEAEQIAQGFVGETPTFKKLFAVSSAYFGIDKLQLAMRWAAEAMAVAKEDQEKQAAHLMLGNIAMKLAEKDSDAKLFEAARDRYAEVLKITPTHVTAGNNLAWLLATKFDQADEAVAICEKVRGKARVEQLPVKFVDTMATVYRKAGRLQEAQDLLKQAMDINSDHAQVNFQFGMVMSEADNPSESRDYLEKAIKLGLSEQQLAEANAILAKLDAFKDSSGEN